MSAIAATLYGQRLTGISFPTRTPIDWTLTCQSRDGLSPLDLTGARVAMTLCSVEAEHGAIDPPVISGFAAVSAPGSAGICTVSWSSSDTKLPVGNYFLAVWILDAFGGRQSLLGWSYIAITAAGAVTPPNPTLPPNGLPIYWRGVWDSGTPYGPLDAVSFAIAGVTSSYVCILAAGGHDPTNPTYWALMAEGVAGPAGAAGSQGSAGSAGATGATGPQGPRGLTGGFVSTAVKTGAYTAVANDRVPCNASGGAFTVALPASPTTDDMVQVVNVGASGIVTVTGDAIAGGTTWDLDAYASATFVRVNSQWSIL